MKSRTINLTPVLTFLLGLGLTFAFYGVISAPSFQYELVVRYFSGHPIKLITTTLFFWAVAVLAFKVIRVVSERRALAMDHLPTARKGLDPISRVPELLSSLDSLPANVQRSWIVRRITQALNYVYARDDVNDLNERLTLMADRDADELDGSYELVRTITWAIPILGFLGTVIGITLAIANITPEQLQGSISDVVGGLSVAFDTTALALALSMVVVLVRFVIERSEQRTLALVETVVEEELLHRFQRQDPETGKFLKALENASGVIASATTKAWKEQATQWMETVQSMGIDYLTAMKHAGEVQSQRLDDAMIQSTVDQTRRFHDLVVQFDLLRESNESLVVGIREITREWMSQQKEDQQQIGIEHETRHARFLAEMESWRKDWQDGVRTTTLTLTKQQNDLIAHTQLLAQLLEQGNTVANLQESLDANLSSLTNANSLDDAVHSLTAAVHLLTTRAGKVPSPQITVKQQRQEDAA